VDVVLEGLIGGDLHEVAGQRHAEVVVLVGEPRRTDPRRTVTGEGLGQRLRLAGTVRPHPDQEVLGEPGRVGEQVGEGHGLRVGIGDLEGGQVGVDVLVEVETTSLDLLHHRGRRDELGDGADVEACARRVDRRPVDERGRPKPSAIAILPSATSTKTPPGASCSAIATATDSSTCAAIPSRSTSTRRGVSPWAGPPRVLRLAYRRRRIAAAGLVAGLFLQAYGAYVVLLQGDLGWSTTMLSAGFAMARTESAVLGPAQGYLIDRFGPRVIMRVGVLLFGLGFVLLSMIQHPWQFFVAIIVWRSGRVSLASCLSPSRSSTGSDGAERPRSGWRPRGPRSVVCWCQRSPCS
jgi:hypothetical protein